MAADGLAHEVVNDYLGSGWKVTSERAWRSLDDAPGNDVVRLLKVRARKQFGETSDSVNIQEPIGIELVYEVLQPGHILTPKVELRNEEGVHLFASHDVGLEWRRRERSVGTYKSVISIPGNFLTGGNLLVDVSLMSHFPATVTHCHVTPAVTFQVIDNFEPDTARGDYVGPIPGLIRPLLDWTTDFCFQNEAPQIQSNE
jgi:lipopolysaccharide transport system ATP-binding protein